MRTWMMWALFAIVAAGALVGCAAKEASGLHDYRGGFESV